MLDFNRSGSRPTTPNRVAAAMVALEANQARPLELFSCGKGTKE